MVVVGPNGAGKSTCYRKYLAPAFQHTIVYHIDPDAIERQIRADLSDEGFSDRDFSAMASEEAARQRQTHLENHVSFSFETVFSDPVGEKLDFLREAVRRGYTVALLAVGLDSPEKSRSRVALRVERGGHHVPVDRIFDRYPRVLRNITTGVQIASVALVVDNSEDSQDNDGTAYVAFALYAFGMLIDAANELPAWWKPPEASPPLQGRLRSWMSAQPPSPQYLGDAVDGPPVPLLPYKKPDSIH